MISMPLPTDSSSDDAVVPFRFGGHIALDFVNTVDSWIRPATRDYVDSFAKVVGWTNQVGLIDDAAVRSILRKTSLRMAQDAHEEAIRLRGVLLRVLGAIVEGSAPPEGDVSTLNVWLKEARANQVFVAGPERLDWLWDGAFDARSGLLLISLEAAELLRNHDLTRLKRCPGPDGCGWLFLDESRNRSRKWCSMEHCGSFAKTRRFAERHRRSA
jgi:predicted RNA-binding Zn ribbon-like protein